MLNKIYEYFRKQREFRKTHMELSKLSAHELRDIGLDRSMITRAALEQTFLKGREHVS